MDVQHSCSVRKYQISKNRMFLKLKYVEKLNELEIVSYEKRW